MAPWFALFDLQYSTLALEIRLPIVNVAPWLAFFDLQYRGSLDLPSGCCCGSLAWFVCFGVRWLMRFVSWLLLWLLGLLCSTFRVVAHYIRLPIADVALWLALVTLQYIGSIHLSPDCSCGSFALLCWTCSTLGYSIRLPIADVAPWLALFAFEYIGLSDSSPNCWCGSLACFVSLA